MRNIVLPATRQAVAELELGEMVTVSGPIVVTAGIPTHHRIIEHIEDGRPTPIALEDAAFFHLGSYSRETADGFEILYMNPTTSTRFNSLMPRIIRHFGLRCVGGKGGLDDECTLALQDVGGVYLSFLGGGAPIISAAIRHIRQVAWDDLISHYRLVELEVEALGPLTVAIDARGNSLYRNLDDAAHSKRAAILERLAQQRQSQ
ncbi:fumarate hydratase C-terminal domain-containing protein [Oryzicola mucosus]|uniref:Fumarate hydratase C-terminal domain-containing protein n=1 Tax=Oryzicola mucosus TaxID=2767425 RepID=A0A8J6Q401_9HYPH|nr:fumarate hydratase C-terminal domain-containing protein [Oryzicola mucosus]MBD0415610.1 fumarate hydratase C-terminal domain-containing protein [Oryzicola mucosus]